MVKKKKDLVFTIYGVASVMLIALASFALYQMIRQGASDLLLMFGITNIYLQGGIIVLLAIMFLGLIGLMIGRKVSVGKVVKDILKT